MQWPKVWRWQLFLCLWLCSCILYLDHLLFLISDALDTVGSNVCAFILVFCLLISFYFRSVLSWVVSLPLFVFIFLSWPPFILDLLCLVYYGFQCLCFYSCILYLYHLLSYISCGLGALGSECLCLYSCIFVFGSTFILDLLCLVDCGFLCLCLYSCILYLDHLLF